MQPVGFSVRNFFFSHEFDCLHPLLLEENQMTGSYFFFLPVVFLSVLFFVFWGFFLHLLLIQLHRPKINNDSI